MAQKTVPTAMGVAEHGQHIFIYGHVRTNQVVYSLKRAMNNHAALKQIPFLGKKTKPAVIRKDFWKPLATISFPSGAQGLSAFQMLREFKRRHELEWTPEDLMRDDDKEKKIRLNKVVRGQRLMDQKANTVADLAAVLLEQEAVSKVHNKEVAEEQELATQAERQLRDRLAKAMEERRTARLAWNGAQTEENKKQWRDAKRLKIKTQRALNKPDLHKALHGEYSPLNDPTHLPKRGLNKNIKSQAEQPRMTMGGLRIEWANLGDAEFANSWPVSVVHDVMERGDKRSRHVATTKLEALGAPTPAREQSDGSTSEEVSASAVPTELGRVGHVESPSALSRLVERLRFGKKEDMRLP